MPRVPPNIPVIGGTLAFPRTICNVITTFAAVVTALAVARVTRLVTSDYLTAPVRQWVVLKLGTTSKGAYLITCDWCTSLWIAAAAAPLAYWHSTNPWYLIPAIALAFSYIVGFLAQFGEDA